MMSSRTRFPAALCVLALFGVLLASCDNKDTPTSPPPPPPGGGTTVTPVRVQVTVPGEIPPGQSVQLSAQGTYTDGSRPDVTDRVQWSSSAPDVLEVSATGLASARQLGESTIAARLGGPSATARVFVVPPGTYRLGGKTHDFGIPVGDVAVEVIEGIGAGLKTQSGPDGSYVFYGVSGPLRIHAKKDGYANVTTQLTVSSHTTRNVELESTAGYSAFTGTYSLIVTAVSPCSSAPFPDAARRRVYTARVEQSRNGLSVRLADADFILTRGFGNWFVGNTTVGGVYFDLRRYSWYYYYGGAPEYQLVERLTANSAVVVEGIMEGTGSPSHVRGQMGTIAVTARTTAPHDPVTASCKAEFELIRR
jgi:hypothetical protein